MALALNGVAFDFLVHYCSICLPSRCLTYCTSSVADSSGFLLFCNAINRHIKCQMQSAEHSCMHIYSMLFYAFRHVILPLDIARLVPKTHLLTETEWRNMGVQQSPGWVHYMVHSPGKNTTFYSLIVYTYISYTTLKAVC